MKHLLFAVPLLFASISLAEEKEPPKEEKNPVVAIVTSKGEIDVELWPKAAPKTVANFLELAEGKKEWKDPSTGTMVKKPLYDGLIFHRVIKDFMVQGGDPRGDGSGDAGFTFEDEINAKGLELDKEKVIKAGDKPHEWLGVQSQEDFQGKVVMPVLNSMGIKSQEDLDKRKDEVDKKMKTLTLKELYEAQGYKYDDKLPSEKPVKGVIAMANSGPNTNSSQFFLNLVDTPWLTGRHTVFGKIVKGMDVLEKIGAVSTDENGKPDDDVKIVSIRQIKDEKDKEEKK